jgi:hypothetical protein
VEWPRGEATDCKSVYTGSNPVSTSGDWPDQGHFSMLSLICRPPLPTNGDRMQPDIEAWESWHPRDFAARMEGADLPWFVAGGWAIDLFLGTRTRDHEDLEVAVPSSIFGILPPRFPDFDFWIPQSGRKLAAMSPETLATEAHQTWAYEREAQVWRFDVFREPHDGHTWICRRDSSIRRPYSEVLELSVDGIPYLRPEICLLFKAKATRDKDRADFDVVLPQMSPDQRAWLHNALQRVHPGHEWISATELGRG